jgi:hypothetical protein
VTNENVTLAIEEIMRREVQKHKNLRCRSSCYSSFVSTVLLDKESRCLGVSEKPKDYSRAEPANIKRKVTEDVRAVVGHPSWADVVKTKPQSRRKVTFHLIKQ